MFNRPPLDEAEQHFNHGLYYRNRNSREFDLSQAIEHFRQAIMLNPDVSDYHTELAKAYIATPFLVITRGSKVDFELNSCLNLAIDELKKTIENDSAEASIHMVLGEAYMYQGDKRKAADAFQKAADASSTSFSLFAPLAFIDGILYKSYAKRSLKSLEPTNAIFQPREAEECIRRAVAYRDQSKYKKADKELMQAFKFTSDWEWLYKTICKIAGK